MPEYQRIHGIHVERAHNDIQSSSVGKRTFCCNKLLSATSEITHILHSGDLGLFIKPFICVYSFRIYCLYIEKICEKQLMLLYIKYDK
jgi:hypothetical protein